MYGIESLYPLGYKEMENSTGCAKGGGFKLTAPITVMISSYSPYCVLSRFSACQLVFFYAARLPLANEASPSPDF